MGARTDRSNVKRIAVAAVILGTVVVASERLREPERSESAAIVTLRAIANAESTYAVYHHGYYDTLECLASSNSCVPGVRTQLPFVDSELATTRDRRGFHFELYAGPSPESQAAGDRSPTAMTHFAVVAEPSTTGSGRRRSFCVDDRQVIYVVQSRDEPHVEGGRCFADSHTLR
jgi:hypothetical protein